MQETRSRITNNPKTCRLWQENEQYSIQFIIAEKNSRLCQKQTQSEDASPVGGSPKGS